MPAVENNYKDLLLDAVSVPPPDKEEGVNKAFAFSEQLYLPNAYFSQTRSIDYNFIKDLESFLKNIKYQKSAISDNSINSENIPNKRSNDKIKNYNLSNRIVMGDRRTTIMIKNIPNKINEKDLRRIIEPLFFGMFNFLYLRLDYDNGCNTGYAFINFISHNIAYSFYLKFQGYKWKGCHKSVKVVDLVYAKIQGLKTLFSKFRNSSVMEMPIRFRPKLYYTKGKKIGKAVELFDIEMLKSQEKR